MRKFSAQNKMDPFPSDRFCTLPQLTAIEEMLIPKSHTVMRLFMAGGRYSYKGSVINLEKDAVFFSASSSLG